MKKIAKLSLAGLAAAAIIGTSIISVPHTSAAVVEPVVKTVSVNGEPVITPHTTDPVIKNESFSGTSTTKQFNIPAGYGHVKLSFVNTGTKQFTFTVNQGSASGTQKMYGVVPADGQEYTFFSNKTQPWSTGWFYVNLSSAQGMSGKLGVRLGTDWQELKDL
ncbi:hypothetical protein [Paenibacillus amylolyticus]|uniref:hypothetical protein n=1 Tax=Paenibacillus amylolyticus TaxID=1451 RepID=UPI003396E113